MTAGRDLHHIVLHLLAHWECIHTVTQQYAARRLRLLYVAVTKGWPAALYYDQQGANEFLGVPADFWTSYQPPPRTSSPILRSTGRRRVPRRSRRLQDLLSTSASDQQP
jgi:hypothetical protein